MSIDYQKYSYQFLTSTSIDYEKELEDVIIEKRAQQKALNESQANELWRVEKRIAVFNKYCRLFYLLTDEEYYKAWCLAEDIELSIGNLVFNFPEEKGLVSPIMAHIHKLQQLYPYRAFSSTEIVVKESVCTICGAKWSPRTHCIHQIRKVYNGEMCCREVTKADLIGISLVTNPEHKYAVLFPHDKDGKQTDQYDYSTVKGLMSVWKAPFQSWDYDVDITYRPKERIYAPKSICPCGSGKYYKDCCMEKPGLRHVHITINPGAIKR